MPEHSPTQTSSAAERPIRLRLRRDIEVRPQVVRGQMCYLLKDPISLTYHRLWLEEYALLEMLDGHSSPAAIKARFESRFAGARLDLTRLGWLVANFFRQGLLISDMPGQAETLLERRREKVKRQRLQATNLLALRLPGINPDRFLTWLNQHIGWLYSRTSLIVGSLFICATLLWMLVHWAEMQARLPSLQSYLTVGNLPWLLIVIAGLKILHELGHGLACKHMGGECHEMGVLLLALMPCLYCDVSDSWTLREPWRRGVIALAGMWIEMLVAALCAWVWWFSQPGLLHSLCFQAMVIGGISTLLINGNPFLRYDGYFVLSDWWQVPNLWQQSRLRLTQSCDRLFFRRPTLAYSESPERLPAMLSLYAVLSIISQWIALASMLLMLWVVLRKSHLELLAGLLVVACATTFMVRPAIKGVSILARREVRNNMRFLPTLGVGLLLLLALAIALVPLPYSVRVPLLMQASDFHPVRIVEPGQLVQALPEGTEVMQSQTLAQLSSPALQLELLQREGELRQQQARLSGLQSKRPADSLVTGQISATQEAIRGLQSEVGRLQAAIDRLTVHAPVNGIVLAPLNKSLPSTDWEASPDSSWSGTPLEPGNVGSTLEVGDILCMVGNPTAWDGVVFLTQSQAELIEQQAAASIRLPVLPDQRLKGRVSEISYRAVTEIPLEMATLLPTTDSTTTKLVEPYFVARIQLEATSLDVPKAPLHNSTGMAKIEVAPRSLASRFWRWLDATFTLNLLTE